MFRNRMMEPRIPVRKLAPAVILILNSLTWFTLTSAQLSSSFDSIGLSLVDVLILQGVYYAGVALSAIFGAYFFPKARETCLLAWMLFGSIATVLPAVFLKAYMPTDLAICLFLGASIGMGLPSALAYFADTTSTENRGSYGGLTYVTVGLGAFVVGITLQIIGPSIGFPALSIWRALGLFLFLGLIRLRGNLQPPTSVPSYHDIVTRREVIFYLLPWTMFSLVNFAESPIVGASLPSGMVFFSSFGYVGVELALSGVFALVAGMLSDRVGRKRIVIIGFIILGVEYGILSLFFWSEVSWYIYTVCDGITWGMFASVFFMTLWGDLATTNQKEKYYVLGGLPYLLAGFLPTVVKSLTNNLQSVQNIQTTAFSLASFFLFVAVLPLMYAPETLPEKRIKDQELRGYVDQAKKTRKKYA